MVFSFENWVLGLGLVAYDPYAVAYGSYGSLRLLDRGEFEREEER
jgi:hypothetical protein